MQESASTVTTSSRDQAAYAHSVADAAEVKQLQTLSLQERGEQIRAACAAAAEIERSRLTAGLPKTEPAPWPQSTWDFLSEHARNARG